MKGKYAVGNFWQKFVEGQDNYEAFSDIYNLYINDLLSYGISLGFSEETCRDAAHDVFFNIFTEKKRLSSVKNPTSYLFRSFRNHLFNIQKRQNRLSSDFMFEKNTFTTEITILDTIINEEENQKLKNLVEELLKELTPRQREAIYLRYMQEMDYEEIALLLNMNANSTRRLVSRGIENLRNKALNGDNESFTVLLFVLLISYNL
ncbi:sigma-70 family RNA polymerase sigma factor [Desulfitobacterium sp.]|jgi:RNA polymerase sigma factor (sigma-70 family)|uniref:RNA polymerase sigma factor n=1 Tax=Desulfitobacterium sp. TaxID=49981 RepID=UPI002B201CA5|nr:sigma-70 family RNA polymerase sigma factor [Desulfitobacterium sp.]MEA4903059.1 sigma-70 family RNA polymerase sigma factor [Desulfitobacterium sp.]